MNHKHFDFLFSAPIILLSIIAVLIFVSYSQTTYQNRQFSEQAYSFLHGRVDIPKAADTVDIDGKHFWHAPPFPSLVLFPGMLVFGKSFSEPIAQALLISFSAVLVFRFSKKYHLSRSDSMLVSFGFFISSVLVRVSLVPSSWHFAQIVAVALLLATVYEMETKNRIWVLGLLETALVATRPTAAGIGLIILYQLVMKKNDQLNNKIQQIVRFLILIIVAIIAMLYFNDIRFGGLFANPYALSSVSPALAPMRAMGVFGVQHILPNIYYYFLAPFELVKSSLGGIEFPYITFNPFGMSVFIVAPFFLYSLRTLKRKYSTLRKYWFVIGLTLIVSLTYFARGGYIAYGPRYVGDSMPLLLLLVLKSQEGKKLSNFQKLVIVSSATFNIYMIVSRMLVLLI